VFFGGERKKGRICGNLENDKFLHSCSSKTNITRQLPEKDFFFCTTCVASAVQYAGGKKAGLLHKRLFFWL
jgi:hypothetical protein